MTQTALLSVVVPCYNEEKNIPLIVKRFREVTGDTPCEIILVNNGSTDNSAAVLEKELRKPGNEMFRVETVVENKGYGFGIMSGVRSAKGEIIAWTHADMQTDPADVFNAYAIFADQFVQGDQIIVKGKRMKRSFGQWGFTFGMSMISSVLLGKFLYDINAQPKMFARKFLEEHLTNTPDDFSLDLYLLYVAKHLGYTIKTIPVRFPDRIHGESKWAFSFSSKVKTIQRTLKYIVKLRKELR